MEDLFIVTASCKDKPELNEKYPQGGDLFKVRVDGIKGVERYKFGNWELAPARDDQAGIDCEGF
jgi:hypothetical protein